MQAIHKQPDPPDTNIISCICKEENEGVCGIFFPSDSFTECSLCLVLICCKESEVDERSGMYQALLYGAEAVPPTYPRSSCVPPDSTFTWGEKPHRSFRGVGGPVPGRMGLVSWEGSPSSQIGPLTSRASTLVLAPLSAKMPFFGVSQFSNG